MPERWKDIFIIITLGTVSILAGCWFIDVLLIDGLEVDNGFLGSVLGGVIGALGVVGTTYFLIEANNKATKDSAYLQDKQIREREYTTFILKQIEIANQILNQCTKLMYKDVNLMSLVAERLEDIGIYKKNNSMKNAENIDRVTENDILDRHNKLVESYTSLKKRRS